MSVATKFSVHTAEYWDFKDAKKDDIHSIAHYPATMVAPMQHELLKVLLQENPHYRTLLDPFHGSGVTLVEGQSLGLNVHGIDINPYAHIITLAKLEKYDPKVICAANMRLEHRINRLRKNGTWPIHTFSNIEKWFRTDIINDLSLIRISILKEPNAKTRRYFWLCFGETVKKYSNTRTTTFKLHIKEADKITEMHNDVISDFLRRIATTYPLIGYPRAGKFSLMCGDSIDIMRSYKPASFDIICTSPPYGENATTVTYGQFSTLQLLWINSLDFKYDPTCFNNFSKIDSLSLGGVHSTNNPFYLSPSLSDYIRKISPQKQTKIATFYSDYENAFRLMARLLKPNGSMILTLGNRSVDRIEFPFVDINKEIAQHYGLKLVHVITRNIIKKRMPYRVSKLLDGQPVNSMAKESILLFTKEVAGNANDNR